jgi:hypothetical protein
MSPSNGQRTRTAEDNLGPIDQRASAVFRTGDEAGRTEILPVAEVDGAAISFARARELALARLDHSASVRRLRRALTMGLFLWSFSILLDLFVTRVAHEGDATVFAYCRALVLLVGVLVLWRLWRQPEPSVRMLWFCDILIYTSATVSVSIVSLAYRGIDSPYANGIVSILLARVATTLAPWQRGLWLTAIPASAYPIIMLAGSQFDARIAAQFADPHLLATFLTDMYCITTASVLLVMAGHFAWRLRRQVEEARNIGRYKLERRLGGGGMGDIWAAFDLTLKHRVALKTVAGNRPGSQVLIRLEREVRALAELTHPNTVRVFDFGVTDDGLWYYAMELLHGDNLRELVEREGPLRVERLLPIARQALRALGEAHQKGIVHRDIKPENVFIAQLGGETDHVKLLDFGIARAIGDSQLTAAGYVAGTPAYIAPEAILGHPTDRRSDIYSFGAMLYYALTAHLPFKDEDPVALFAAHVSRAPAPVSSLSPWPIPRELEHIIEQCMAKRPDDRYASTQALLEALRHVDKERPAHSTATPTRS